MDPWIREFDRLTRLADEIFADINEKTKLQKQGQDVGRINYSIQSKVNTLITDSGRLQSNLSSDPRMSQKELRNRQDMLQGLLNRTEQLNSFVVNANNSNSNARASSIDENRASLLEGGGGKRAWGRETEQTTGRTNKGVVQLQNEIMEHQDKALDMLSDSISRQKEIATNINEELDVHTRLLDHMEGKVERTQIGVARETVRVVTFQEKASTGFLWCVIFLLIVAIIVLAVA